MVLSVGYLSDRVKIYKLIFVISLIIVTGAWLIVYDIWNSPDITKTFDLGFVMCQGFHPTVFMLCVTTISKSCGEKTRGSMFFLNGTIGSIAILLFQMVGGPLFDKKSENWPFIIGCVSLNLFMVLAVFLGIMGKLKY
jgi:MFS family permease